MDDVDIGSIAIPEGGFWELGEFETEYGPGMNNPWEMYAKKCSFWQGFLLGTQFGCGWHRVSRFLLLYTVYFLEKWFLKDVWFEI